MLPYCQNKLAFYYLKKLKSGFLLSVVVALCSFAAYDNPFEWCQRFLMQSFDANSNNVRLKKWEINITSSGFLRLRKYYPNGKQEYFSFSVKKLSGVDYLGSTNFGDLILRTAKADIIVQTYNDPKGNVDSMSHAMRVPLENVTAEQLDTMQSVLFRLKNN